MVVEKSQTRITVSASVRGLDAPASLAVRNRSGRVGKKVQAATDAMVQAVRQGSVAYDRFRHMRQKELKQLYDDAQRTTLVKAREAALQELECLGYNDKAAT